MDNASPNDRSDFTPPNSAATRQASLTNCSVPNGNTVATASTIKWLWKTAYRRVMLEVEALQDGRGATCTVNAYIKPRGQFSVEDVRLGPLQEYTPEHAALYRRRESTGTRRENA